MCSVRYGVVFVGRLFCSRRADRSSWGIRYSASVLEMERRCGGSEGEATSSVYDECAPYPVQNMGVERGGNRDMNEGKGRE